MDKPEPVPDLGLEDGRATSLTAARIGLGRAGDTIRTGDALLFQLDHAAARDAVHAQFNTGPLLDGLHARGWPAMVVHSAACVAGWEKNRRVYLQRPDLGRRLSEESMKALPPLQQTDVAGVSILIADGLSATAVERYALPLLDALLRCMGEEELRRTPVCLAHNGRVALGDHVGERLRAQVSVVLIGERPGLSSPDSMGAYITWEPRTGRTDAQRNCISNIRLGGLSCADAAARLRAQLAHARQLGSTGVRAIDHRPSVASAVPVAIGSTGAGRV